ncbi:hypothetical protein YC2023_072601 [Brassica napus]
MNAGNFKTPCMDVHKLKSTYMQGSFAKDLNLGHAGERCQIYSGDITPSCLKIKEEFRRSCDKQSVYCSNREAASGSLPSLFEFFGIAGEKITPWKDE